MRALLRKSANLVWSSSTFMALLVVWELASRVSGAHAAVPPPTKVVAAIARERRLLFEQGLFSVVEAYLGLSIGLVAAFVTASALVLSERVNRATFPLVLASQTVPLLAIAPILAAIIGEGVFSVAIITAWLCWFPAVIALSHGFRDVSSDQLTVFKVAGATSWQTYLHLRLPGAVRSIVSGVRSSAGFALIGTLVAEYGNAKHGLGAVIIEHVRGINVLPSDALFGLVVICSLLGIFITWTANWIANTALMSWL
jgi:ABC-type nitrate/sulfonate/bicarbonate transport system permease component